MSLPPGQRNLWARNLDRAIYLPSVQPVWAEVISCGIGELRPNGPFPAYFDSSDFLNFFLPLPKSAFWWPRALYSPGHAPLDLEGMKTRQSAVLRENRDARSLIVSDSGGYQIGRNAAGPFRVDWDDAKKANALRKRVLTWQEAVSEWAVVLDIPSFSIVEEEPHPYFGRNFSKCLKVTLDNLRYILDNRSGATNFLNVIQGQDAQQVDQWYAAVKDYPFEGWSMPIGRLGWSDGLRLLRRMLDEQKLDRTQWIHFLGIGTAHSAVAFSTIKRTLRSLLGSNALEISYDTSSPFQSMSRYELNAGFERRYIDRLSTPFQIDVRPSAEHIDSEEPFLPYQESPVLGGGIYGNDAYVAMGEMHLPKVKGKGARFDKLSLVLIAVHNIWSNLSAISDAHDRVEGLEATPRAKPFMGNSIPDLLDDIKKHYEGQQELKGAAGQIMALLRKLYEEEGIPSRLPHGGLNYTHNRYDNSVAELMEWSLEMNEIVREVLTSQTPDSVLEKNKKALSEFL